MSVNAMKTGPVGVSCCNIEMSYGSTHLFKDLTIDFEAGRCTCLLGPSGCGKSTLIRMISGVKSVAYKGKIGFQEGTSEEGSIAWMSQKDLLLPWLTVIDNISLGAKLRGELTENVLIKARGLLVNAGMADYEKQYPAVLSGGMRQRVALLRTLLEERPVILMDEPFSALDALTRFKLQDLSAQLTRGKTVILVTHDPMEALRLGDRIVVLGGSPARIVADVTPDGEVPRPSGGTVLTREYPRLLQTLMDEGVA